MTDITKIKNWLSETYKESVRFDEPMRRHTTFRTGGPADIFVQPSEKTDAIEIINTVSQASVPLLVIGGGSNLLISDNGIRGVVISLTEIRPEITATETGNTVTVTAGAGIKTHDLCRFAIKNGLAGMNFALGIPGTIGGAISMNAGTATGEMKDVVTGLTVLNGSGVLKNIDKNDLIFSYRKLDWQGAEPGPVIFDADFRLTKSDPKAVGDEADKILERRRKSQPVSLPSAGCIFKNPDPENPAGKLIDLAGLKGMRKGDAQISDRHANFIVNRGNAKSSDIEELILLAQKRVLERFNIRLETEVKIVE